MIGKRGSTTGVRPLPGAGSTFRLPLRWLVGMVVAILYGSWLPFEIDFSEWMTSGGLSLEGLSLRSFDRADLLTNIFIYMPLGLAGVLTAARFRWFARLMFAVALGCALSILAELVQQAMPLRVASWVDVGANGLGALMGALVGLGVQHQLSVDGFVDPWRERPLSVLASVLTVMLLLYHLVPFDFIWTAGGLEASFLRARWDFWTVRPHVSEAPPLARLAGQVASAGWFALLAYLQAMTARESGKNRIRCVLSAVKHVAALALVIEFMQLFTSSHVFDFAAIAIRCQAAILGAWCAVYLVGMATKPMSNHGNWRRAMPSPLLWLAALTQVGLLYASSYDRLYGGMNRVALDGVRWLPFESLWWQPFGHAVASMLETWVTYAALLLTLGVALRRIGWRSPWMAAGVWITLLSLSVESLRWLTATHHADATGPTLAVFAAVVVPSCFKYVASTRLPLMAMRSDGSMAITH